MSIWLRKRLLFWFSGAAALSVIGVGASMLEAQYATPKTPGEATRLFQTLVRTSSSENSPARAFYFGHSCISRSSYQKLGLGVDALVFALHKKAEKSRAEVADKQKSLPVIVIRENGGWKVDLLATYRKQVNLPEGKWQQEVFDRTSIVLNGLPNKKTNNVRQRACLANLKGLSVGIAQYVQDYDDFYPQAKKWNRALLPYSYRESAYNCPSASGGKFGYAFNANLALKSTSSINDYTQTVLFYETNNLQPDVAGEGLDLAWRHQAFLNSSNRKTVTNIAYADGKTALKYSKTSLDFSLNPKTKN